MKYLIRSPLFIIKENKVTHARTDVNDNHEIAVMMHNMFYEKFPIYSEIKYMCNNALLDCTLDRRFFSDHGILCQKLKHLTLDDTKTTIYLEQFRIMVYPKRNYTNKEESIILELNIIVEPGAEELTEEEKEDTLFKFREYLVEKWNQDMQLFPITEDTCDIYFLSSLSSDEISAGTDTIEEWSDEDEI